MVNFKYNKWDIINPGHDVAEGSLISQRTIEEIGINKSHDLYFNELCEWTQMVEKLFKNNRVIQWTWTQPSVLKCERIIDETDGLLHDHHWSEKGHQQFAEWFINCHNNNNCVDFFKKK